MISVSVIQSGPVGKGHVMKSGLADSGHVIKSGPADERPAIKSGPADSSEFAKNLITDANYDRIPNSLKILILFKIK